jgi:hypothetical protein
MGGFLPCRYTDVFYVCQYCDVRYDLPHIYLHISVSTPHDPICDVSLPRSRACNSQPAATPILPHEGSIVSTRPNLPDSQSRPNFRKRPPFEDLPNRARPAILVVPGHHAPSAGRVPDRAPAPSRERSQSVALEN